MHFLGHLTKLDGKASRWPTLPHFLLLMPTHGVFPPLKIHPKGLLIYTPPPPLSRAPHPPVLGDIDSSYLNGTFPFRRGRAEQPSSPSHTLSEEHVNSVSQPALHPHLPLLAVSLSREQRVMMGPHWEDG